MQSDDENQQAASRRSAIGLLGGLVAAPTLLASTGATAQTASAGATRAERRTLVDPRDAYPKPPFAKQTQEWPGLASRMQPRPDHGERSYVGSGRLAGRKALLTGGDSGIGRAAAIAYAREGADVAINYLPAEEEDAREGGLGTRRLARRRGRFDGHGDPREGCCPLMRQAAFRAPVAVRCGGYSMSSVTRSISSFGTEMSSALAVRRLSVRS